MNGWQPIETAPRDGTPFLAYNGFVGVYFTAFTTRWKGEPFEEPYAGFPCGFYPDKHPRSYRFGKWDCAPSHWHPLPERPENWSLTKDERARVRAFLDELREQQKVVAAEDAARRAAREEA